MTFASAGEAEEDDAVDDGGDEEALQGKLFGLVKRKNSSFVVDAAIK
jgi:hypothetical protein